MQLYDGDLFTLLTTIQAPELINFFVSSGRRASLGTRSRFGVAPRCVELFNHQLMRLYGNMSFCNRHCLTGEGEA